jgi:ribosomal protein S21
MAIDVRKKEGESIGAFLFRFNKKIQQSGLVREVRSRQTRARSENRRSRRLAALYRVAKRDELADAKRYGGAVER